MKKLTTQEALGSPIASAITNHPGREARMENEEGAAQYFPFSRMVGTEPLEASFGIAGPVTYALNEEQAAHLGLDEGGEWNLAISPPEDALELQAQSGFAGIVFSEGGEEQERVFGAITVEEAASLLPFGPDREDIHG